MMRLDQVGLTARKQLNDIVNSDREGLLDTPERHCFARKHLVDQGDVLSEVRNRPCQS